MHKFKYWFSIEKEKKEFVGTEEEFKKISEQYQERGEFVRVTKKKLQRS